jgi:hypothetical protein
MSAKELQIQFKRRDFIILQRGSLALAEKQGREKDGKKDGRKLRVTCSTFWTTALSPAKQV